MNIPLPDNERGVTLVELVVALGLTGLLLMFVVSGVLFVERYIDLWRKRDRVAEDTTFVAATLSGHLERCCSFRDHGDSLVFRELDGSRMTFRRTVSNLYYNGQPLVRESLCLDSLSITPFSDQPLPDDTIVGAAGADRTMGLFRLTVVVSGSQAADTFSTIVRNSYAYHKFAR